MKQIILIILILPNLLFSYEFKLNQKDRIKIEKSNKKSFILKRLEEYQKVKKKVQNYDLNKKLSHINFFINGTMPEFDNKSSGIDDYWMTPKEFFINGYGDCEDYVIAKYFTLIELGIKKEYLYLAIVGVKGSNSSHMVLLYLENKNSTPLVLDNLSFKVLPLTKRDDLIPQVAFNEIDSYQFTNQKFTNKVSIDWENNNKWDRLLNRVYNLNE